MSMKRRTFLKGTLAAGTVGMAVSAGLLTPRAVMAAWPKDAFEAKSMDDAMQATVGGTSASAGDISIKAPDIAENGAVVPVTVSTSISGVESISIFAKENANPLTSSYMLGGNTEGFVSTRIKMGKTSDVIAVVKADGKLYNATKEVKVTIGGCGG
ncbi:MAG: thiosulfate oxidation carrier protein SoxY [Gammaproteobacteria bacterium]|nr:thiosulfate oxidation carrier protein SoxY [Gammaproteobacteria bacterium]MDX5374565.1 thiosulfate oxidation carrier protein SoxY [Gammaproteobacteria bacterium]